MLNLVRFRHCALALALFGLAACGQRSTPPPDESPSGQAPVLTAHWAGKHQVLANSNTTIAQVWAGAPSRRLEAQTLQKLAGFLLQAAARPPEQAHTNSLAAMLADAINVEGRLALAAPPNQPVRLQLALRLDDAAALRWSNSFGAIFAARPGPPFDTAPDGSLAARAAGAELALTRHNGWTLLQINPADPAAKDFSPCLLAGAGDAARDTNLWFHLTADLAKLSRLAGKPDTFGGNAPRLTLRASPAGSDLRVSGALDFPRPTGWSLPDWSIPTNLIGGRIDSFTALRGVASALGASAIWNSPGIGEPPDQFYSWTPSGIPFQMAVSFPEADPAPRVARMNAALLGPGNEWLKTRADGGFILAEDGRTAIWRGLPFIHPVIAAATNQPPWHVHASTLPLLGDPIPFPVELKDFFASQPRLIYYDWQLTGPMLDAWLARGQSARLILRRDQLPGDSASLQWLKSLRESLGNSTTTIAAESDRQWSFSRRSPIGLTALELHLLADWLEAPGFPRQLRALEVPAPLLAPPTL